MSNLNEITAQLRQLKPRRASRLTVRILRSIERRFGAGNRRAEEPHGPCLETKPPANPATQEVARMLSLVGFFVLVVCCSCAGDLVAADHTPNAALKYWQAFAVMPKTGEPLETKLKTACEEEGFARPISQKLVELVDDSAYALRMLQRGGRIADCDWGVDFLEDGAETLLPYLIKARKLSRLALVRARHQFEQNDNEQGLSDVSDAITLARHVSHDGTVIGLLVGYSIEMSANRVLAAYLPQLGGALLTRESDRLGSTPRMRTLGSAMESEGLFLEWAIDRINTSGEGRLLEFCETMTTSRQQAEELLIAGGSRERFTQHLEALRPFYAEAIGLFALPQEEFEEHERDLTRRLESNPLYLYTFPNLNAMYLARDVYSCHASLLSAAMDIQDRGIDELQTHTDPYGDGPFELLPSPENSGPVDASAYRLRSKLTRQDGTAVELSVGRPGR